MFVDETIVRLRAGRGGNGCMSFRREKFVPKGGPDGGDGGAGGSIHLCADHNLTTLYDFSLHPNYRAQDGKNGGPNRMNGRAAEDLTLRIPIGTTVIDDETSEMLGDLVEEGARVCGVSGGRGGGGNARFASAHHRLPRFALRGAPGQARRLRLVLKLISDLSIVGLPNCGKSTLLAAMTAARPKIADYPFTTLHPNLGVLRGRSKSIVLADIPGIVEGAHEGRGLGNRFLRHISRSRALVVMLDASSGVVADFKMVRDEILQFDPAIWERERVVVVNKLDIVQRPALKRWEKEIGEAVVGVSAKTGLGIEKLTKYIEILWDARASRASQDHARPGDEGDERPATTVIHLSDDAPRIVRESDAYRVISNEWEELASMIPAENVEAIQWFTGKLRSSGVMRLLSAAGARPGDSVAIGDIRIECVSPKSS